MKTLTPEQRMKRLSPSHDHFEQVLDPWHVDAFAGMPEVDFTKGNVITKEGNQTVTIKRGVRLKVWYSVDWCGNLIQAWGEDTPPGEKD